MHWRLKPQPEAAHVRTLAHTLGIPELLAALLLQRGIGTFEEAKRFFRPALSDLHDPYRMKDMDKAVARIEKAVAEGEKILVYGDYDVDGTTAVSLLYAYLTTFYAHVGTYIPDRMEEGYGISYQGIDFAAAEGFSLVIALDCGIKEGEKTAYASTKGVDFIVCDHHQPGAVLPKAAAVLNPKQADCDYPYKELCGCGVGFKLVQALALRRNQPVEELLPYLDLVATAIGADMVPVTGENRVLAYHGLRVMNTRPRPGLRALLSFAEKREITVSDVVFTLAPRINAAGRMRHGCHAVALLTEADGEIATELAKEIEFFNTDRRSLDQQITEEALQQIKERGEQGRNSTVVYSENWHKGVIGIVASRLTETYYRPTVVFTKNNGSLVASARSVNDVDLYHILELCSGFLEQFGGHRYAAGLTMKEEQYNAFKQKFEEVVSATIHADSLIRELRIDAELDFLDITPKFCRVLKQFAPFGPGNRSPVFVTHRLQDTGFATCVGEAEKHLRVFVKQPGSEGFAGIGFNLGEKFPLVRNGKFFTAAYSIEENEWNGETSIQLKIKDIQPEQGN